MYNFCDIPGLIAFNGDGENKFSPSFLPQLWPGARQCVDHGLQQPRHPEAGPHRVSGFDIRRFVLTLIMAQL